MKYSPFPGKITSKLSFSRRSDILMFQARRLHLKLTRVDPEILEGVGPEPRFIIRTQCKAKSLSLQE